MTARLVLFESTQALYARSVDIEAGLDARAYAQPCTGGGG